MAERIGVIVLGAKGRMGRAVVAAVEADPELDLAGALEHGDDVAAGLQAAGRAGSQVVAVDFTRADAVPANAAAAIAAGVAPVIGTTGLEGHTVTEIASAAAARNVGGAVIPNFAVGAVLMVRLAELAAPYFDAVEVVEAHADTKLDAPSGTALHTAERLAAARGGRAFLRHHPSRTPLPGTRGGELEGVGVHSLRLPGLVADQEVILGAPGQTLTIAHRTTSRECFMPGVLATVRAVVATRRFYRSLDQVLGLVSSPV
jgi:4-hydroxy-tetrahydrodipicolinate reductase